MAKFAEPSKGQTKKTKGGDPPPVDPTPDDPPKKRNGRRPVRDKRIHFRTTRH